MTRENVIMEQPIEFSHEHHVSGLGLDCRYCHTTVETGPFAGMPPTQTCMGCHEYVWADSPMLAPVRASYREGRPIAWTRINDLPDFVYFDHSVHVQKGIGCVTCHGPIHRMPLTWAARPFFMEECLECHRAPERFIRSREKVFDMDWQGASPALVDLYGVRARTDCTACHR